jgi:hypothetical protein
MEKPPMIGFSRTIAKVILGFSIAVSARAQAPTSEGAATKSVHDEGTLRAFAAIHPIDVHVHVFRSDPTFQKMLERLNLNLLNILVMDDTNPHRKQLQQQIGDALALARSAKAHVIEPPCDPRQRDRLHKPERLFFVGVYVRSVDSDHGNEA